MPSECISFQETGYFSELISDYLEQKESLKYFYNRFPTIENFKEQIVEKQHSFPDENRKILRKSLVDQYQNIETSEATKSNLELLLNQKTFTITTGHQLNLFTGPLYFLYKIISTINLSEQLSQKHTDYNFVPVYWMATEDHDFLEINHFSLNGKKISWNKTEGLQNTNGYVGDYDTKGLEDVFKVLSVELGVGKNADYLKSLFQKGYLEHDNLTDATRFIVNELFGKYGLLIVDGNDKELKTLFSPIVAQELKNNKSFETVSKTTEKLENSGYKAQVNPREINLFYGVEKTRERIVKNEDGSFIVNETNISWNSLEEITEDAKNHPERFSPNVILRPVYQEIILPNLCYIGGGGELAYWFQLKENFEYLKIPFPILLLRNSALLVSKKQEEKARKLKVSTQEFFMKQSELINYKVRQISDITIDFSPQKEALQKQFEDLKKLAKQTDKSFIGAVKAQQTKQIKGLENLEKRLLKAQRLKLSDHVDRLTQLQNELFPQQSLQERKQNFAEFYLEYGENLIPSLKNELRPLSGEFNLVIL